MRRFLPFLIGVLPIIAGIVCAVVPFGTAEKPNTVYVWGHWLDVRWELGLPLLLAGAALLAALLARRPVTARPPDGTDIDRGA